MPTKPPAKLSDVSGLVDELQATDQVFGLRLSEADASKRNKRWTLQKLADYVRGNFTPIETSAGIKDATEAGRKMLTAQDAAAQLTLVDSLVLAGDASIGRPDFTRAYRSGGALLWLIEKVSLLLSQAAPVQPAAPTHVETNDVAKEWIVKNNGTNTSYAEYGITGLPGTTGEVQLGASNAYPVGDLIYIKGVAGAPKGSLVLRVMASGSTPAGKPLSNPEAFTGTPTPTAPATAKGYQNTYTDTYPATA